MAGGTSWLSFPAKEALSADQVEGEGQQSSVGPWDESINDESGGGNGDVRICIGTKSSWFRSYYARWLQITQQRIYIVTKEIA